jgi:hypothetical protein
MAFFIAALAVIAASWWPGSPLLRASASRKPPEPHQSCEVPQNKGDLEEIYLGVELKEAS